MIKPLATALAAFLLGATPALADVFNINLVNDESFTVIVTVTDMNVASPQAVSGNIDGGRQISFNINGDSGSNGHITWKATNLDRSKCGSGDVSSLGSGSTVTIRTPSSC